MLGGLQGRDKDHSCLKATNNNEGHRLNKNQRALFIFKGDKEKKFSSNHP